MTEELTQIEKEELADNLAAKLLAAQKRIPLARALELVKKAKEPD